MLAMLSLFLKKVCRIKQANLFLSICCESFRIYLLIVVNYSACTDHDIYLRFVFWKPLELFLHAFSQHLCHFFHCQITGKKFSSLWITFHWNLVNYPCTYVDKHLFERLCFLLNTQTTQIFRVFSWLSAAVIANWKYISSLLLLGFIVGFLFLYDLP